MTEGAALLAVGEQHGGAVVGERGCAAVLSQYVVGLDGIPVVLNDVFCAKDTAGFFIGHREVDDVAGVTFARPYDFAKRHQHRRRDVQHIDSAAAPNLGCAVGRRDQFTTKRVIVPALGTHGHNVGMAHQTQRRRIRVCALVAGDKRCPVRLRLEHLKVDA